MNSIDQGRGQGALTTRVRETKFCTACGACVNLCPYQASYQDEVVTLHACDLKKGDAMPFVRERPRTWTP